MTPTNLNQEAIEWLKMTPQEHMQVAACILATPVSTDRRAVAHLAAQSHLQFAIAKQLANGGGR